MKKTKITCFKLTSLDFEFLRKQAKKAKITVSELLRRRINDLKDEK